MLTDVLETESSPQYIILNWWFWSWNSSVC